MLYTNNDNNNAVLMAVHDWQKHHVGVIDADSWNVKPRWT